MVTETKKGRKRTANNYEQLTSLDCYTEGYNETSNNNKNKSRPLLFHYWKSRHCSNYTYWCIHTNIILIVIWCGNVDGSLWKLKIGCIFSPVNIKFKIYKIAVWILPRNRGNPKFYLDLLIYSMELFWSNFIS